MICIVCGARGANLYPHPKGSKIEVPLCEVCIRGLVKSYLIDIDAIDREKVEQ